jgi:hypothetical protein
LSVRTRDESLLALVWIKSIVQGGGSKTRRLAFEAKPLQKKSDHPQKLITGATIHDSFGSHSVRFV